MSKLPSDLSTVTTVAVDLAKNYSNSALNYWNYGNYGDSARSYYTLRITVLSWN